ncbi:35S rRNA processing protein [Candida orthopsilosis Co 90-125]|uniref:35S rRNA processing protein n=1 Tax=Candida orthopsilosis (strain 90-125) TaxID=1136231 RepID=H8X2E1_CANO9|nr:35S rRNA processing protein [Candida orthopsilosis Co 90-125]CCG25488.1 35S rRNA processing protein [Candida orthopsilosis Co 90-125]
MDSSETESYASDKISNTQDSSLDELFSQLSEELHKETPKEDFKSIEASIRKLPKLESNFGNVPQNKAKVVRIHDPVAAAATTKKQDDTSGSGWFNMSRPELTSSIKRDLQIIKQRQALDPKRHYKKEKWQIPKYFQMGTIVEGNTGYYNKLTKKQKGTNLVEELLHDDNTKKYFKRKYHEIQQQKTSGKKSHYKKVRSDRKKF